MITPRSPVVELPVVALEDALAYVAQACLQHDAKLDQHLLMQGALRAIEEALVSLQARAGAQDNGNRGAVAVTDTL